MSMKKVKYTETSTKIWNLIPGWCLSRSFFHKVYSVFKLETLRADDGMVLAIHWFTLHSHQLAIQGFSSGRPSHLDQDTSTLMQMKIYLKIKILSVFLYDQSTMVEVWEMRRNLKEDLVPLVGVNVLSPLVMPATIVVQLVGTVTCWPDGGFNFFIFKTMEDWCDEMALEDHQPVLPYF